MRAVREHIRMKRKITITLLLSFLLSNLAFSQDIIELDYSKDYDSMYQD